MRRLCVVLLILILFVVPTAQAQTDQRCFTETNQCISGRIRAFWEQNGGLPVFGFPTGPQQDTQIEGKTFQAQTFERNRLELHPENARPYDVLLGRLGDDLLKRQGRDWNTFPKVGGPPQPGCLFYAQTGHSICGSILNMYRSNGLEFDGKKGKSEPESLALFGLPLSEAQVEDTPNGKFTVQWYERARFEVHPENQPPYDVLLGLLGNETAAAPAPPPPPPPPGPPPLPQSVNAVARPERGPRGTRFFFIASGFKPGEKIGVYITIPDQSVFGAPFQTTADKNGVSDSVVSFRPPDDPAVPTGIWAVTFEGVDSHNKAIAYFEVTGPEAPPPQPQPQPPAPPPGGVPTPNAPCNQNAPGPAEGAQAWMTITSPTRRSNTTLCVRLIVGGKGVVGATASGVAHYKTTDTALGPVATGGDGVAAITFNVGGPTPGYTVAVDVTVTANGQTYHTRTSFTPQ